MMHAEDDGVYEKDNVSEYVDNDEMSSSEAAFMEGYDKDDDEEKGKKKKKKSEIFDDFDDEDSVKEEEE